MIKQETFAPAALCTALRFMRSEADGGDGNQVDAASRDGGHEKAARPLWRAAGLRALSIRQRSRKTRQDCGAHRQDIAWTGRARRTRRSDHDLVGVRIDWKESELRAAVKRAGGIRRPRQRLWEISWDAVRTLGLQGVPSPRMAKCGRECRSLEISSNKSSQSGDIF